MFSVLQVLKKMKRQQLHAKNTKIMVKLKKLKAMGPKMATMISKETSLQTKVMTIVLAKKTHPWNNLLQQQVRTCPLHL